MARRRKKKKHSIRKFIIAMLIIGSGGVAAYAHYGGAEAQEHLSSVKSQIQSVVYETGEKLGLAEPTSKFLQQAQGMWRHLIPNAERKISLEEIPEYAGTPFVEINHNIPEFEEADLSLGVFERYSALDFYGRCGTAYAMLGQELMPEEERESISEVLPSGWNNVKYQRVNQGYLYNRCHLIGFQLAGENANEKNLITGTRYLNVDGMLPLENKVAAYIMETGNHVLYRVTPIYEGRNLVASGVQMEARSMEDNGEGICFNVYCHNVQPGIEIDYATGESREK